MSITIGWGPDRLSCNREIYGDASGMLPSGHDQRFACWWAWAERHGLNRAEYLLPQLRVTTSIAPFSFEQRFVRDNLPEPAPEQVRRLGPWAYQVEMGRVSTLGARNAADWTYHRYRNSLLIDTISHIAGDSATTLSVLDVACHCGLFTLELGERGFGQVTGLDLRARNIDQAYFLADTFGVRAPAFRVMNARELGNVAPVDIVLCAGLLYHVTFPLELLRNLFAMSSGIPGARQSVSQLSLIGLPSGVRQECRLLSRGRDALRAASDLSCPVRCPLCGRFHNGVRAHRRPCSRGSPLRPGQRQVVRRGEERCRSVERFLATAVAIMTPEMGLGGRRC